MASRRWVAGAIAIWLTGCSQPQIEEPPAPEPAVVVPDPTGQRPVGPEKPPPERWPRACPQIFEDQVLQTFELELDPAEWAKLQEEYQNVEQRKSAGLPLEPYHRVLKLRHGDRVSTNAMIRLRGNPSYWFKQQKMQFQISFNEQDPDGRFRGLRKILLDSAHYNPTYLRDRLAMSVLRDAGIPAPCVNHAKLFVNGTYYGLFAHLEKIDREFLERAFAEADANLYKRGQILKTNEDQSPDTTRIDRFWKASTLDALEALVDVDQLALALAGEAALPDADGYWAGGWNFYLYDHPARGFLYLPWDIDLAFDNLPADTDPLTWHKASERFNGRPHVELLLADETWRSRFIDHVGKVRAAFDPQILKARIDRWSSQIEDAARDDPHPPWTFADHQAAVRRLRSFVEDRAAYLDAWLCRYGSPCR